MLLKACLVVILITVSLSDTLSLPVSEESKKHENTLQTIVKIAEELQKRLDLLKSRLNAKLINRHPNDYPTENIYFSNPPDMNYGSVSEAINWIKNFDINNGTMEYYTEYMKSNPLNQSS